LSIKLLSPVTFTQILTLADEESLINALRAPSPAANILAMTILEKAAATPSDAAILSVMSRVIEEFIRRWLLAPQVEVGEKGGRVLGELLEVDCELAPPDARVNGTTTDVIVRRAPGQGRLWRRIFADRAIFSLIISLCRGQDPSGAESISEKQLSLAQGRLLRLIPRIAALNFVALSKSEFTDLTGGSGEDTGIIQFVALRMVEKDDMLMHLSLVDFFETLLSVMRVTEYSNYKMGALRRLLRQATAGDPTLKEAILSLPDRTVPEESDQLRGYITEVMS
jgi:hypothetical protein